MADDPKQTPAAPTYSESLVRANAPRTSTPVRPAGWAKSKAADPAATNGAAVATAPPPVATAPPKGAPVELPPSGPSLGGFVRPSAWVSPAKEGPTRNMVDPVGATKALALADRLPDPVMQADVVAQGYLNDPYHVYKDELIAAEAPRWYETIFSWFEPFDYPRRYLWNAVEGAGQALPNPTVEGEASTVTSSTGDAIQWAAGKLVLGSLASARASLVPDTMEGGFAAADAIGRAVGWSGYDPAAALEAAGERGAAEEIGRRFYGALSAGKLYEKGAERRRAMTWDVPIVDLPGSDGADTPYATGTDILDFAAPKELAERAAAGTSDPASRAFWTLLSSDAAREIVGLSMEMAMDPLWFVGPAAGGKVVHAGGKVYEMSRPLVRAVARAAEIGAGSRDDLARAAVHLVAGTPDEAAEAGRIFDAAIQAAEVAQAQRVAEAARLLDAASDPARHIDEAQRVAGEARDAVARMVDEFGSRPGMAPQLAAARRGLARMEAELAKVGADPGKAAVYLNTMARKAALEGRHLGAAAAAMRRGTGFARGARGAAAVQEVGSLTWHIPFGTGSRYVVPAGAAGRGAARVARAAPAPLLRMVGEASEWAERSLDTNRILARVNEATVAGRELGDVLSPAERLTYAWHLANGSDLAGTLKGVPLAAVNMIAQVLGTRHVQPFIARLKTVAEAELHGSAGRTMMSIPFLGRRWVRLQRVAPQAWDAYQQAVTGYFRRLSTMEGDLVSAGIRISGEAKRALDARQRIARGAMPAARRTLAEAEAARARAAPGSTERAATEARVRAARAVVGDYERWLDPKYNALDIMLEAGDIIERGGGLVTQRPELARLARVVDELVAKHASVAGKDEEQVRQALVNMARFMEGNPQEFAELGAREALLLDELREVDVREGLQLAAVERFAAAHRARVASLRGLTEVLSPENLAVVLDRLHAEIHGTPWSDSATAAVRRIVHEVVGANDGRANEVFRRVGAALGMSPEHALVTLSEMARGGLVDAAGKEPGRILADQVLALLARLDGEAEAVARVARGEFDLADEAKALTHILGAEFEKEVAALRVMVGADNWTAFKAWAENPALPKPAVVQPARLARAKNTYDRVRALGETVAGLLRADAGAVRTRLVDDFGVKGAKLGEIRSGTLLDRRIEEAVRGSTSEADAVDRVRYVTRQLLNPDADDHALHAMIDAYATRLGRDLFAQAGARGARGAVLAGRNARRSIAEARSAALRGHREEGRAAAKEGRRMAREAAATNRIIVGNELAALRVRLGEVKPRFAPPDGKNTRALEAWERNLWIEFEAITENLTTEDRLLAAFAALRHTPDIPKELGPIYDEIAAAYPRVMGRRLGDVPADLQPVVYELRGLIKSYEELYIQHGMDFAKTPADMLKRWGVVDYVPHMLAPTEKLRTGAFSSNLLTQLGDPRGTTTLDGILSMQMDANRLRTLDGTIRELNAAMTNVSFTLEPTMLVARYLQANRSISAKEFLVGLIRGGVIRQVGAADGKPAHLVATELDLVPLLRAPNLTIDLELFLRGDRGAWERAIADGTIDPAQFSRIVQDLAEWTTGLRKRQPESSFATWLGEVPELQASANIEEALMRIRMTNFRQGVELFDPVAEHAALVAAGAEDLAAWDRVADRMRTLASASEGVSTDALRKASGRNLALYFAPGQESWRLYVPRAVAQSMTDLFEMPPGWDTPLKRGIDKLNTFWKTRVTILSLAFSARNAGSNVLTNILDVGAFGALSPKTNLIASQMALAATFVDNYGSLERAAEILNAARGAGESVAQYAVRQAELGRFKVAGLEPLLRYGVDLGDGVTRGADDAIKLLKENGVISASFAGSADIGRLETAWAEIVSAGGLGTKLDRSVEWLSRAEDALVVSTSMLLSGGLPVSIGKELGGTIARITENQARMVNFIANLRRSGDIGLSAAHVEKFLFNYNDLTALQRVWMRAFIPFFTWTFKNIELQIDMMVKSPAFYAQFNRMLLVGFPRIAAAIDADAAGKPFMPGDPSDPDELRLRSPHTLSSVRLPLPKSWVGFQGAYLEGLGLPQEAFVEQMGMIASLLDAEKYSQAASYWDERSFMRFLGQTNFVLKMLVEWAAKHHSFYDRPLDKLTNGALIDQVGNAMGKYPIVGPMMQAQIEDATGLVRVRRMNTHSNEIESSAQVLGVGNWLFANVPYSRVLRDAAAASDLHRRSLASDVAGELIIRTDPDDPFDPPVRDLPWGPRVLDAVTGVRLIQENEGMRQRVYAKRLEEAMDRQLEQRGVVREVDRSAIRKR